MKLFPDNGNRFSRQSHPARGAWIEMSSVWLRLRMVKVAPRKGCVD